MVVLTTPERPRFITLGEDLEISFLLTNTGNYEADEIAQLYIRDLVGNVTRPVKELKGFKKIRLKPGESKKIDFTLSSLAIRRTGAETRSFSTTVGTR